MIEEALRKHMEENDKAKGQAGTAPAPEAPPPLPPAVAPDGDSEPVRKAWPILLAMSLGGLVLVIGIVWLLLFGFNLWRRGGAPAKAPLVVKVEEPAAAVTATEAVEVAAASAIPSEAVSESPAAVTPSVESVPQPLPVAAPESVAVPAAVPAAAPVAVPAEAPAATPAAVPAETPRVAEKVALPVVWPKLVVNGLMGGGRGGRSAAMINRQMVEPGVVLEGVRVEAIERNGVRLSYQGETRLVSVGGTTE